MVPPLRKDSALTAAQSEAEGKKAPNLGEDGANTLLRDLIARKHEAMRTPITANVPRTLTGL
jgi:hypothetical protein